MQLIDSDRLPASEVRIGIALPGVAEPPNEPVKLILAGGATGKTFPADPVAEPKKLILPADEPKQVMDAQGEPTSSMTWQHFVERRQFSCEPRVVDRSSLDRFRKEEGFSESGADGDFLSCMLRQEQRADVVQATLEFVGEVGELSELIGEHGVKVLWGDRRAKLIDECGDILFTGTWLIEAWARNPHPIPDDEAYDATPAVAHLLDERPIDNPLLGATDTELYRFEEGDIHAQLAVHILNHGGMKLERDRSFVQVASATLVTDMIRMLSWASLTANAAKKLAYQHREQDAQLQIDRVLGAFHAVNFILCVANSSVEEAMIVNRAKLDKRYPDGYQPGVGGGIRTEG